MKQIYLRSDRKVSILAKR